MSTFGRIAVAFGWTLGVAIGGVIYYEVYMNNLQEFKPDGGPFVQPVTVAEYVVPIVLLTILLAVWVWVVVGSVQEERAREMRRVRP